MSGTSNTHSTSSAHSRSREPPSRTSSYALPAEASELPHNVNTATPRRVQRRRDSEDSSGYAKSTDTSELLGTAPASESGTARDRRPEAENRNNHDSRSSGGSASASAAAAAPKESGTDGDKKAKIEKWIEDTTSASTRTSPSSQRGSSHNASPSSFTSYGH